MEGPVVCLVGTLQGETRPVPAPLPRGNYKNPLRTEQKCSSSEQGRVGGHEKPRLSGALSELRD
jgi:hypothetical protein